MLSGHRGIPLGGIQPPRDSTGWFVRDLTTTGLDEGVRDPATVVYSPARDPATTGLPGIICGGSRGTKGDFCVRYPNTMVLNEVCLYWTPLQSYFTALGKYFLVGLQHYYNRIALFGLE